MLGCCGCYLGIKVGRVFDGVAIEALGSVFEHGGLGANIEWAWRWQSVTSHKTLPGYVGALYR